MRKNIVLLLTLFVAGASLSACANTVHGAGEDIENAGENIQNTVE